MVSSNYLYLIIIISLRTESFKYFLLFNNDQAIGLMSRVFANGPGNWGSILGRVIPKTQNKNGTWQRLA